MNQTQSPGMTESQAVPAFDPLDMRNYALEKYKEIKAGVWMNRAKMVGVPLAVLVFLYFHLQWSGRIDLFETQTKVKNAALLYSTLGIFLGSLILWLTEAVPVYLTSFLVVVVVILTGILPMREAFAYMGEPVMILNIGSFIMASALVVTGLGKRVSLYLVLRMSKHLGLIFWAFILLNLLLGAFISATSAKTALLLPLFMVISAMYGATGGERRNSVGRNMVLQNLLANNVSASAFITGSAANLLAALMLEKAGAKVFYGDWLIALLPLAVIQCAIAWWTGAKLIFPISKADATLKLEGGMQQLADELKKLGPISSAEIRAGVVFLLVLALWATDKLHGIRAEVVAVAGACAVMFPAFSGLPSFGVMKWNDADIPWHMLMFSWGAYVLGGMVEKTGIMDMATKSLFASLGLTAATPKVLIFLLMSGLFGFSTLISESKTARTIIMFPIMISVAKTMGWDLIGFCLPMAFMINQVYVLYFNSKPANISYLTDQYSTAESFKFGMVQLILIWLLLPLWAQYVMPLMGFNSKLW